MDPSIPASPSLEIKVNERIFLKDPQTSKLGLGILNEGLKMVDERGFEGFTFKKLAEVIDSTEASIYRYFENKHKFLIYLVTWYWTWLDHMLLYHTHNLTVPTERLRVAIRVVGAPLKLAPQFNTLDIHALHRVVVNESPKAYLSKDVDEENKEGYFIPYKRLSGHLADIIREARQDYPFPTALASTLMEAAHYQAFFAKHLPRLTEIKKDSEDLLVEYLTDLSNRIVNS